MNLLELNGIKVYNLTSYFKLPEWASRSEKRKYFKKDPNAAKNFQLIQELEMPDTSTYVTCSPDQQYLFLLGRYKPRVRCYELNNLSMKFDRCVDYLPLNMTFFSDDYSKFALVQEDRWVDVHYAGGHFFKFRIPKPCIDSCYCPYSCDLFVTTSGNAIYRMNLSEGRFNTPLEANIPKNSKFSFTASSYDSYYNIIMASSTMGRVDGWDTRCPQRVFGMDISLYAPRPEELTGREQKPGQLSCTALLYRDSVNLAVGTNQGLVHIYDIRQNKKPWHTRDTGYRNPVKSIAMHDDKVLAMVSHCVKIWNIDDGKIFVGFDTGPMNLNWMHHMKDTGLIFLANDAPKCMTYFIPLLGDAPSWAHHLDQLVYEFEPEATAMYDGYKFLTRQQLAEYGMLDLIGTSFLRAYMHGYFVSKHLYDQICQKLGIHNEPSKNKVKKDFEVKKNYKVPSLAPEEKIIMASVDERFCKLKKSSKMSFQSRDEEAELMRIHEARLQKKRRRKEQRLERAEWSSKLLKGENLSQDHDESRTNISDNDSDTDSRGRGRGQFSSTNLSGLRETVRRRLFDPNAVPSEPSAAQLLTRLKPISYIPIKLNSVIKSQSTLIKVDEAEDIIKSPKESYSGDKKENKKINPGSSEFLASVFQLDCLMRFIFRCGPDFHRFSQKEDGISLAKISEFQSKSVTSMEEENLRNFSVLHLLLDHENINKWKSQLLFFKRYNPARWYPSELVKMIKIATKKTRPLKPTKRKPKKEDTKVIKTSELDPDLLTEIAVENVEVEIKKAPVDDEDDEDDELNQSKSNKKAKIVLSDEEDEDPEDARWNGRKSAKKGQLVLSDEDEEEEEDNDYCHDYFDNGEGDHAFDNIRMDDGEGDVEDYYD